MKSTTIELVVLYLVVILGTLLAVWLFIPSPDWLNPTADVIQSALIALYIYAKLRRDPPDPAQGGASFCDD